MGTDRPPARLNTPAPPAEPSKQRRPIVEIAELLRIAAAIVVTTDVVGLFFKAPHNILVVVDFFEVVAIVVVYLALRARPILRLDAAGWVAADILALVAFVIVFRQYRSPWPHWERELRAAINACEDKGKDTDKCVAHALTDATKLIPPSADDERNNPLTALASAVRAGHVLMSEVTVRDYLQKRLGVDEKFTGIGLSLPVNAGTEYWSSRLPERLVPNFNESHAGVWVWPLDPAEGRLTLRQLINDDSNLPCSQGDTGCGTKFKNARPDLLKRADNYSGDMPPVVRFAQISTDRYSGCLGPRDRLYVFASLLNPVMDVAIRDAGELSGFRYEPSNENTRLFVMLFCPTNPEEVLPATWKSILLKIESWEDKAPFCSHN